MLRPSILLLTVLLAFRGAAGADQSFRAVLIETAIDQEASGPPNLNYSLAQALKNYLEYSFFRSGEGITVFLAGLQDSAGNLQLLRQDPSITSLTHLTVSGRFENRLSTYTDRRRVSRFVTRPECLELRVIYTTYERIDGSLEMAREGRVLERARSHWLKCQSGEEARRLDSLVAVTPEPNEYVIRRAIERLFDCSIGSAPPIIDEGMSIPTIVVVDSSFVRELGGAWRDEVDALISTGSHFLSRDYGRTLALKRIDTYGPRSLVHIIPAERFLDFRRRFAPSADTLIIGLYCQSSLEEFFGRRETDAIGLSVTGERILLLRHLPPARPDRGFWRAHINSLVLVHELGHILGAIHVSDPQSIMCHNATWLAPNRFDAFNREVVAAALGGDFDPGKPRDYLEFLSHKLDKSPYPLVDYPPVLYRYLQQENLLSDSKVALKVIGRQPFLSAAEGFGKLIEGDRSAAAELFADAWRHDEKQACLPYYLSQVTAGLPSMQALRSAAGLGYWHAQLLLQRFSDKAEPR